MCLSDLKRKNRIRRQQPLATIIDLGFFLHNGLQIGGQVNVAVGNVELSANVFPVPLDGRGGDTPHPGNFLGLKPVANQVTDAHLRGRQGQAVFR